MIVNPATQKGSSNTRAAFRNTTSQVPIRQQISTKNLESCLPPDAKLWERAVVGFCDLMSKFFG